jgi:hypothetical protein
MIYSMHAGRSKFQSNKSKIILDVSPQLSRKAGTVELGKLLERYVKEFEASSIKSVTIIIGCR